MRIAYIGNFEPEYSTENDVRKAFEFLGHEVIRIQENIMQPIPVANIDLLLITSTWDQAIPLPHWLNIVKMCADLDIPTATLHLDTFWSTPRQGRKWWLNPMFHTAYIFTADGDYQDKWKLLGKNHIWLPPAVRHDAVHKGKFREEYACDIALVGSNGIGYHEDVWPYRKELVLRLFDMCHRNDWVFKNPGGNDPKIDRGEDMNDFYASAKVTVGDSLCLKKEDSRYWSDRVPEATGRGGYLIMPQINELNDIYLNDILMYKWGDWANLELNVKHALEEESDRELRRNIAHEITKADHTYVNRAKTILETVGL